uniref:Uncharacterized protein n=1 Tax=Mola mola TaxID=94237 RepID=A0A3Q4BRB5_MOLML
PQAGGRLAVAARRHRAPETQDLTEEETPEVPAEPIDTTEVPLLFLPEHSYLLLGTQIETWMQFPVAEPAAEPGAKPEPVAAPAEEMVVVS